MRVHIGGKISRFSLLNMTITEAKKTMGETGIHGLSPCQGRTVKKNLFYRVSRKIAKNIIFKSLIAKEIV